MKIERGAILFPREELHTDLWENKPAWWFKVWTYLVAKANFKDHNQKLKRGDLFTTRDTIYRECCLSREGIKPTSVDNLLRYLRNTGRISTQKTTRGIIITICHYNISQDFSTYKYETENDLKTIQKRDDKGTNEINETNYKGKRSVGTGYS